MKHKRIDDLLENAHDTDGINVYEHDCFNGTLLATFYRFDDLDEYLTTLDEANIDYTIYLHRTTEEVEEINYYGGKDIEDLNLETTCYVCGKEHLKEGYHIDGAGESYCSKECLLKEITEKEFDDFMDILEKDPNSSEAILYWTAWEDEKE